jgi:putative transposase
MAIRRRGKPDSLQHHSELGSQYTSEQVQRRSWHHLLDVPVRLSLGVQDDPWSRSIDPADRLKSPNAAMERFFTSLNT